MTVNSAETLQRALEHIARLRRGIEAIRIQVEEKNTKNFDVLTEGPRAKIAQLEAEVDEYLSCHSDR